MSGVFLSAASNTYRGDNRLRDQYCNLPGSQGTWTCPRRQSRYYSTIYVVFILYSTRTITPTLNKNSIMLRKSLAESAGHYWQPAEFENVANPDFENLKHLQNPGHVFLTKGCMYCVTSYHQCVHYYLLIEDF